MSVFKYHAFIYFMRPPPWYGTRPTETIMTSPWLRMTFHDTTMIHQVHYDFSWHHHDQGWPTTATSPLSWPRLTNPWPHHDSPGPMMTCHDPTWLRMTYHGPGVCNVLPGVWAVFYLQAGDPLEQLLVELGRGEAHGVHVVGAGGQLLIRGQHVLHCGPGRISIALVSFSSGQLAYSLFCSL